MPNWHRLICNYFFICWFETLELFIVQVYVWGVASGLPRVAAGFLKPTGKALRAAYDGPRLKRVTTMSNENHTAFYAPQFKSWAVKTHGPKPTALQLEQAHGLGCRPGKQALAVAMGLREGGVTNPQVLFACGNPQNNKRGGLVTDGYLKRNAAAKTAEGHEVYQYTVTPKGLKRVEATKARAAALAKAGEAESGPKVKKAAKGTAPRKPKAAPVADTVTGDTAPAETVTETVQA